MTERALGPPAPAAFTGRGASGVMGFEQTDAELVALGERVQGEIDRRARAARRAAYLAARYEITWLESDKEGEPASRRSKTFSSLAERNAAVVQLVGWAEGCIVRDIRLTRDPPDPPVTAAGRPAREVARYGLAWEEHGPYGCDVECVQQYQYEDHRDDVLVRLFRGGRAWRLHTWVQ